MNVAVSPRLCDEPMTSLLLTAGICPEGSQVPGGQADRGHPRNRNADLHHQGAAVAVCGQPGANRSQIQ